MKASTLATSATQLGLGSLVAVACVEPLTLWPLALGLVAFFALVGALPLAWLRMRRGGEPLSVWLVAGSIALGGLLAARPWSLATGWPIAAACGVLLATGPLWVNAIRNHRRVAIGAWIAATVTLSLSTRAYFGLYPTLHVAAVVVTLSLAALGASSALAPQIRGRVSSVVALAMLGSAALSWAPWASRNEARRLAIAKPCITPHLLLAAWSLSDFDDDGASTLWGGADCDAFDPERGPGNWDIPGDGIDQDCTGRDRAVAQHRAARQPAAIAKSVLIITADSLRADALGAYGSQPLPVSINFDAWVQNAVRFERAYAAAPETRASLPVMLWGQNNPSGAPSLAQRVKQHGRKARVVLSTLAHFGTQAERSGFDVTEVNDADSLRINSEVWQPLHEVAAQGGVLWVHYHDPHAPYTPVPGIDWGSDARAHYFGLVTRMDRALRELLDRAPPDMAVIFSADHGEAFGEHGGAYYHRSSLYDEQIRIPLAIAAPGVRARVVPATVGLIDIYATTLDLLGLPATPGVDSRSLVAAMQGEALPDAPYRATTWSMVEGLGAPRTWVGLFYGNFKLLRRTDWNVDEIYDVRADPKELRPNAGKAASMHGMLVELL